MHKVLEFTKYYFNKLRSDELFLYYKNIYDNWKLILGLVFVGSILRMKIFFHFFNLDIFSYLSIEVITMAFLNDLLQITVVIIALSPIVILNNFLTNYSKIRNWKIKTCLFSFTLVLGAVFFLFKLPYLDRTITISIFIIVLICILIANKSLKKRTLYLIERIAIIGLIVCSAIAPTWRAANLRNAPTHERIFNVYLKGDTLKSGDSIYMIGYFKDHLIFFNDSTKQPITYPTTDLIKIMLDKPNKDSPLTESILYFNQSLN